MCTIIVTIRTVLWYVMSLAGTLMILVALFTNKWLDRSTPTNFKEFGEAAISAGKNLVNDGKLLDVSSSDVGLFLACTQHKKGLFEGECVPSIDELKTIFTKWNDETYPHAWRGAILCFSLGLFVCVITDLFALLTVCCRRCICCSVFTVCGTLQSFASILFTLGMLAYAAGWGSKQVSEIYCVDSAPFLLGDMCNLGDAFWLALAGTVCTVLASSLAIWAYQSTRSQKAEELQSQGDRCICLA